MRRTKMLIEQEIQMISNKWWYKRMHLLINKIKNKHVLTSKIIRKTKVILSMKWVLFFHVKRRENFMKKKIRKWKNNNNNLKKTKESIQIKKKSKVIKHFSHNQIGNNHNKNSSNMIWHILVKISLLLLRFNNLERNINRL